MKKIRTVFCGCGKRTAGTGGAVRAIDDYEVIGVCDPYEDKAIKLADLFEKEKGVRPAIYTDHIKMLEELKPDAAVVVTNWETHVRVAIDALERGVAVAMEVGGAYDLEECWELVDTWERTKTPFMFLENCCFNKDELLITSLVRNGVMGEISYASAAYGHDIREEVAYGNINRHYRLRNYITRNADNYPTHNLGPIAKIMNVNRGNRMLYLTSVDSKAVGLKEYMKDKPELADLKDVTIKQADVIQTMIKCENGELITLKLDTTLPRYYSREMVVAGTKGRYNMENQSIYTNADYTKENADGVKKPREWTLSEERFYDYLPDIWKNVTDEIIKQGHGGMDYFEFLFFADCLKNGKEMPVDVYDAASWMSITCLSEKSLANNGMPIEIPDFTRGKYKTRESKDVCELPVIKK